MMFLKKPVSLAFPLTALLLSNISVASAAINQCDKLALNQYDTQAKNLQIPPVDWHDIQEDAALKACASALKKQPKNARFAYQLGRIYYKKNDYKQAKKYLLKAAKQNYAVASNTLGNMYEGGDGVTESEKNAEKWYKKAINDGNALAYVNLYELYLDTDENKAKQIIKDIEKNGTAQAQYELAEYFYENDITDKAIYYYKLASKNGSAVAFYSLGYLYDEGDGVSQSDEKAIYYYKKAIKLGDAEAANSLGVMYQDGQGVEQSYEKAAELFRKSAEKNNINGIVNLGVLYDTGNGVTQSYKKGYDLFNRAIELNNDATAIYNIGLYYEEGRYVKQSYAKAIKFYKQSAEQEYESAMENLASLYEQGKGVKKSKALALKWYREAAKYGSDSAAEKVEELLLTK